MSNAYAVAGVTAILQGLIGDGFAENDVTNAIGVSPSVRAVPPDMINGDTGINIFFYQATPNPAWRNECLPSQNARAERITNQPMALDLHYLISAHAENDLFSEILLGSAMQSLHEKPVVSRGEVKSLLSAAGSASVRNALSGSGLSNQLELIKVTPEFLSNEDMSKLWSAVQSNYRSSATYMVTVVLIEAEKPARPPLPVLTRHIEAQPHLIPPTPTLVTVEYENQQIVGRLGESVSISGYHLNQPDVSNIRVLLRFSSENLEADIPLTGIPDNQQVQFSLPADASLWRAGVYELSLVMDDSEGDPIESNRLPLTIAPSFANFSAVRNADDTVSAEVIVTPEIHDSQSVSLIIGQTEQVAESISGQSNAASFEFPHLDAGDHWARIRVDGIDSILINRAVTPPEFHLSQQVTVP